MIYTDELSVKQIKVILINMIYIKNKSKKS